MSDRIGITFEGVYDGVAVWVNPDGSMVNRFEHYKDDAPGSHMRRAYEAAEEYINNAKKEAA